MAVIPSSPTEPIESVSEMESIKNTNENENEAPKNESEKSSPGPAKSRKGNPGIRVVGSRIYDPESGKSCHQCRQKTKDFAAECRNTRNNKPCPIKYCHKCLLNRYGEKAEEVARLANWICPKCRGICNCSLCMKKRGHKPTGILIHAAKANGYSSVSEMLQVGGQTNLNSEKILKDTGSSPEKKATREIQSLTGKRGKEDTSGENVHLNLLPVVSSPPSSNEHNSKKVKLEESRQKHDDGTIDQMQEQDKKSNNNDSVADFETIVDSLEKDVVPFEKNVDSLEKDVVSFETIVDPLEKNVVPEIMLPVGTELMMINGIEVPPQDVGNALQFLEFCHVFGELFEVKKGQPECILRDLTDGRSSCPGRLSLTVQFHIHLISLIQEDRGQRSSDLSPTHGRDSWIIALKECICGSDSSSEFLEHLDKGADGYESLNTSDKLMILNMLCDEALGTAVIRSWIDDQIAEHAEKAKEEKGRVFAAKDKEKHLKQKVQDEFARVINEKNGAPLTISEHESLLPIKREAAQAHNEMLETMSTYKKRSKTSAALRTKSIHLGTNGCAYWKLNCLSESSEILVQGLGKEITSTEDRWYYLDDEQKEVFEKHVSKISHRRRRRRVLVDTPVQSSGNNEASPSGSTEASAPGNNEASPSGTIEASAPGNNEACPAN